MRIDARAFTDCAFFMSSRLLSIEECRELLKSDQLSDKEVRDLRDALYGMADTVLSNLVEERDGNAN